VKIVLLAGPTASGKSRLALDLARRHQGVIVNADSMQVYGELRVLTARPAAADEAEIPHRLYGHVPARERYSVGRWLSDIAAVLTEARRQQLLPIIVGGTGLYFKALTEGLARIPPIPSEVRTRVLQESGEETAEVLHRRLAAVDPEDARRIRASDRARIVRALEIFEATGRSLAAWQERPARPLIDPGDAERIVLDVDRKLLHERIAERISHMIAEGALAEVRAVAALNLDKDLPAMKAIGVGELMDHVAGRTSLDEALAGMRTETRRYAKRQMTWFRHQMADWGSVAGDQLSVISNP
jgi:tRNA dimethylallyltransferase